MAFRVSKNRKTFDFFKKKRVEFTLGNLILARHRDSLVLPRTFYKLILHIVPFDGLANPERSSNDRIVMLVLRVILDELPFEL